jgi:hypothetical protein
MPSGRNFSEALLILLSFQQRLESSSEKTTERLDVSEEANPVKLKDRRFF